MGRTPIMEEQKRILMDLDVITSTNDCAYIVQCFGLFISQVFLANTLQPTCIFGMFGFYKNVSLRNMLTFTKSDFVTLYQLLLCLSIMYL